MERIGVKELRQHASRYLARVKAGETVEITDRGELVALLVPAAADASARQRLIALGSLLPGSGRPLRLPPVVAAWPGSPSSSTTLHDLREERL